mgnify:CR=1 FL=1
MLSKLAGRNAKRSMRDYLVYLLTMVLITALMFAFNSMIFFKVSVGFCVRKPGLWRLCFGVVTFFIVLIESGWYITW